MPRHETFTQIDWYKMGKCFYLVCISDLGTQYLNEYLGHELGAHPLQILDSMIHKKIEKGMLVLL